MRRRTILIGVIVVLAVVSAVAVPAIAQRRAESMRMGHPGMGMGGPALTSEQQEQADAIREKYEDRRVELVNRMQAMALEVDEAFEGDAPDFNALEKKIDEAARVRADLAKLQLGIHKEIRGILTDDQRAVFDDRFSENFGRRLMTGGAGRDGMKGCMGRGRRGMMGRGGRGGCGMKGGMGPGGHGMMGGMGLGAHGMKGGMGLGAHGPMIWQEETEDGKLIRKMIFVPEGHEIPEGYEMHFEMDHDGDSEGHSSL